MSIAGEGDIAGIGRNLHTFSINGAAMTASRIAGNFKGTTTHIHSTIAEDGTTIAPGIVIAGSVVTDSHGASVSRGQRHIPIAIDGTTIGNPR